MRNKRHGFTLIELMLAIVIGAVLLAIAVPAYLNYIKKAKLSEGYIMLQKMVHGVYANFGKPAQVLHNGELYLGESRYPTGGLHLLSQAIRIKGERYRTYAPLPTKKDNHFRLRRVNVCNAPNEIEKRCGSILVQNIDYLESMGFTMRANGTLDQYSTHESYFIPSIRGSTAVANNLIADGFPAVRRIRNRYDAYVEQSSMLTVMADLDGDGFEINDEAYRNAGRYSAEISRHSPHLTYLSRILYIDQTSGELKSTSGIIKENLGE